MFNGAWSPLSRMISKRLSEALALDDPANQYQWCLAMTTGDLENRCRGWCFLDSIDYWPSPSGAVAEDPPDLLDLRLIQYLQELSKMQRQDKWRELFLKLDSDDAQLIADYLDLVCVSIYPGYTKRLTTQRQI